MMKINDVTSLVMWPVCIMDDFSEIEQSQHQLEVARDSLVKVSTSYRIYNMTDT